MKIGIIGGGISGLSTAYYLRKFRFPASQISVFEASSRLGGWINSKRVETENETVYFEKGPRTLRLSTGDIKEINSISLARELNLDASIDIIPNTHVASQNRFIYFNNNLIAIKPKLFGKTELLGKGMVSHMIKEYTTRPRDPSIEDESIWSFIARRIDPIIADNIVDPVFMGICGGDVRYLSAATFLDKFYKYEIENGSIAKGLFKKKPTKETNPIYSDLVEMKKMFTGLSVWRLKNGMNEMIKKLNQKLSSDESVKIHLNEPLTSLDFANDKSIKLKTKTVEDDFDLVISTINSQTIGNILPEKYEKLKGLLNRIETVNMIVINFYFKKDILPVKGFGYLVPSNQKSPILGCIFDSVFNLANQNNTVLTVMMGGAWYDEYFSNKSEQEIYEIGWNEVKKHLNLEIEPDIYEVSILKNSIPQYKVGHLKLVKNIEECLAEYDLDKRLHLTGVSFNGIGMNDSIFNARKLVQEKLARNEQSTD